MDLLAYWKWVNYEYDRATRHRFSFNSDQPRMHSDIKMGERVWLVCGQPQRGRPMRYFLAGCLVVAGKEFNAPGDHDYGYGKYRVVGDPEHSTYYAPDNQDVEPLVRELEFHTGNQISPESRVGQTLQTLRGLTTLDSRVLQSYAAQLRVDPATCLLRSGAPTADPDELDRRVARLLRSGTELPTPAGQPVPERVPDERWAYKRDAGVKAKVLQLARGHCELCGQCGPFALPDGRLFLETHHARPLSEGGPDTVANTVAVCPNCHRRLHLGADAAAQTERLYQSVGRLVRP